VVYVEKSEIGKRRPRYKISNETGGENMIDSRMQTFLTVCVTMNFTAAARKLNITQPAVSQQIHYLEDYYKVKLFSYKSKKLRLTPKGELLRKAGTLMMNSEAELRLKMQDSPLKIKVEFGVTETIGEYAITPALARFIREHPDISITMHVADTEELAQEIEEGKIQFALVEGYFDPTKYDSVMYRTVPFVPVCSPAHRFAKKPQFLSDLFKERLIIREPGNGTRRVLENHLALMGCKLSDFSNVTEVKGMHTLPRLLEEDAGISFLYETAAADPISQGKLQRIRIDDFFAVHDFKFIWEKGSAFEKRYREICKEIGGLRA
jgi:DNA-binding transcriptional LysR family regulator